MAKNKWKKVLNAHEDNVVVVEDLSAEELMGFETWWAARSAMIPAHHHKEIIQADFSGRGVKQEAKMEDFDKALKAYGVNLAI